MRVIPVAAALILCSSALASSPSELEQLLDTIRAGIRDFQTVVSCESGVPARGPTPSLKPLVGLSAKRVVQELGLPRVCELRNQDFEKCITWGKLQYGLDARCEGWRGGGNRELTMLLDVDDNVFYVRWTFAR